MEGIVNNLDMVGVERPSSLLPYSTERTMLRELSLHCSSFWLNE